MRASRRAPATRTRRATSSATASASSTRSTARASRRCFLLPTWSIIHSRHWKMQIPYLARHCRVLTFDGRGNGRSDRPPEPDAYREEEFAADALAVMDATDTERAVLVSLSRGAERSLHARREPPGAGRQAGVHRAGSAAAAGCPRAEGGCRSSASRASTYVGWGKWNRHYWLEHYEDFLEFFFSQCFTEPHSTKQREDASAGASRRTPRRSSRRSSHHGSRTRRACASCSPASAARCS